ncbi:MAG TPA: wax ester/triacylglycerol synthase family O-acyltransferase, partial [Actinomycetota bacterium]|nr:wax ester/triacylglycerol synthase family O-acyltransferase [Actinomycetota bacterium]
GVWSRTMRQLTSLDAQFLAMESRSTYGHVSGLAIYDPSTRPGGKLELADVCRLVGERIHMLPPFRWKLAEVPFGLDLPYWIEDPDFDIDFHVRESAVPPPGNKRQVAETVARLVARPLDRAHPLWELYVVHGIEGGKYVGLLTKVHHAAVDGVSGAEILGILLDLEPDGRDLPPKPEGGFGEREPSQWEMLGRGVLGLPRQPVRAAGALPATVTNLTNLPGAELVPGLPTIDKVTRAIRRRVGGSQDGEILGTPERLTVPPTSFNGRISPHRRFAFDSLPLDRIKAIKNELGITVNDVVVATCATAMREWMLERGELPDEPLVTMVPVSVRTPEQRGEFGNRVSAMIVPIPTNEADPRKRLMKTHDVLKVAKTRHKALPANVLQDATQFIPPALFTRANRVVAQLAGGVRPLNFVISNVPGPPVPLYLAGARLVANYPVSVITDGVGLNITCLSYLDHVDFGIVVDREMIDDAWPLMNAVRSGMADLDAVVCGKRMEPSRPKGRAERQKLPAS